MACDRGSLLIDEQLILSPSGLHVTLLGISSPESANVRTPGGNVFCVLLKNLWHLHDPPPAVEQ